MQSALFFLECVRKLSCSDQGIIVRYSTRSCCNLLSIYLHIPVEHNLCGEKNKLSKKNTLCWLQKFLLHLLHSYIILVKQCSKANCKKKDNKYLHFSFSLSLFPCSEDAECEIKSRIQLWIKLRREQGQLDEMAAMEAFR